MPKDIQEAEIVKEADGFNYKHQYREYSQKTKEISTFSWTISFLSLLFSIVPIFGFFFALFALAVAAIKKTPLFIPIISLFIASTATMIVLFISWVLSLIF